MNRRRDMFLIAACWVLAALPAAAQNLLVNHSFDADVDGWLVSTSDITLAWRGDAGADLGGSSGPGAAEVRHFFWNGGAGGPWQEAPVSGAATYRFAASLYRPGSPDNVADWLGVHLEWYTEAGVNIARQELGLPRDPPNDVWLRVEGTFTAPSEARRARVYLLVGNPADPGETRPGIGLFDDLVLAEAGADTAEQRLFLPAAARVAGARGTQWRTSVFVANLVDVPVEVSAALLLPGRDNTAALASPTAVATLPARGSLTLEDVVGALGEDGVAGGLGLRLRAEGVDLPATLVAGSSYTFTPNPVGAGAFGQGIPAVSAGSRGRVGAPGVRHGANHRSNVGVLNTSEVPISVDLTVRDAAGATVGAATWTLQPFEQRQAGVSSLGASSVADGSAAFDSRTPGGSFRAYLSVVDQATGDPVYVEAR